jgi:hypothetical protein
MEPLLVYSATGQTGAVIGVSKIAHDISDRKRIGQLLIRSVVAVVQGRLPEVPCVLPRHGCNQGLEWVVALSEERALGVGADAGELVDYQF